jgi:hypothetical protein
VPAVSRRTLCGLLLLACSREAQSERPAAPPLVASPAPEPALLEPAPDAGARAARADTSPPPLWSVPQLREHRGLPAGSAVRVRGHVVRLMPCPACPAPAKCKPCTPALDVAERADSPLRDAVYLSFIGPDLPSVDTFRLGEEYIFFGNVRHWVPPSSLPFVYLGYRAHEGLGSKP